MPFILFGAVVAFLAVGLSLDPSKINSPLIGKPMPAFAGEALQQPGRMLSRADLIGRPGLVNVWASWCVACLDEHPVLMELSRQNLIPIYGINYRDTRKDANRWLGKEGNPYRFTIYDEKGKIGIDWGVYGVPETYLIDAEGIIHYKVIGPITREIAYQTLLPMVKRM